MCGFSLRRRNRWAGLLLALLLTLVLPLGCTRALEEQLEGKAQELAAVSYTHLTLPTILRV